MDPITIRGYKVELLPTITHRADGTTEVGFSYILPAELQGCTPEEFSAFMDELFVWQQGRN